MEEASGVLQEVSRAHLVMYPHHDQEATTGHMHNLQIGQAKHVKEEKAMDTDDGRLEKGKIVSSKTTSRLI
jgi:hypothetical protein